MTRQRVLKSIAGLRAALGKPGAGGQLGNHLRELLSAQSEYIEDNSPRWRERLVAEAAQSLAEALARRLAKLDGDDTTKEKAHD